MQEHVFTIDLTRVDGDGTIKCPKCGVIISPDDTSEEIYTVLEPAVNGDTLSKITLKCNKCKSTINLIGFEAVNENV